MNPGGADGMWTPVKSEAVYGEELAVHRFADLPALAFVHGLEDTWSSWTSLSTHLAPRYRCYPMDMPWRTGGTYKWRLRGTAPQWIEAGLHLIPESVSVLVAHSLGANSVLQWLAAGGVAKFDAMVLLSPFYWPPSMPVNWAVFDAFREDFTAVMTAGLRTRLGDRALTMDPDVFDGMARKMIDGMGPQAFLALFDQYSAASQLSLGHIDIPTLVIGSPQDAGLAGDRAEALKADMPCAELYLDARLTHFCHLEQPREVADLILSFLDGHRAALTYPTMSFTAGS